MEITIEDITSRLDRAGADYTHRGQGTDEERVEIPGYGTLFWDDQSGVNPGWVLRTIDGVDEPIEPSEIMVEIEMVCDHVQSLA